jgi:hypothetical protein
MAIQQPKTWSRNEIIELMTEEYRFYSADCRDRIIKFSADEAMDNVLGALERHGLIEDTP